MKNVINTLLVLLVGLMASCKHQEVLIGNWQVVKMEPKNKVIQLETLLALGLAKDQTIEQIHFDKDSVVFLNSNHEVLMACSYSYDKKTAKISLNQFPLDNTFTKAKNQDTLHLIVGEFYYDFAKK